MKKHWTRICALESKGAPTFPGHVWLSFLWVVKNSGRDWDNTSAAAKFILDGLVVNQILPKDSMMIIQEPYIHFRRKPEKGEVESVILTISNTPLYEITPLVVWVD